MGTVISLHTEDTLMRGGDVALTGIGNVPQGRVPSWCTNDRLDNADNNATGCNGETRTGLTDALVG